jgi:hypothetical protein
MERPAVDPDGAGATIALIAALLDAETAVLAEEGAEALARRRFGGKRPAVDGEIHR